ncbi:MAG: hypothetical protein BMS9Abin29_2451 [Gemmatimonadota bacterium]|nr:MAG: hypothetical protein BMS9Abin29_2451 [Gemmatimonadota bacterium]
MSLWQTVLDWFGEEDRGEGLETASVALVLGMRDAAYDLVTVELEIEEAHEARPDEDFTQARLFTASARLLKRCADSLIAEVSEGSERVERWRSDRAIVLYRAVIDLMDRSRAAVVRPPGDIQPVRALRVLANFGMPAEAEIADLIDLNQQLEEEYAAEIAFAQARLRGLEQQRLNELVGLLRSRANMASALLSRGLRASAESGEQWTGRALFNEVLVAWLLIVQELVSPNVTDDLQLGPQSAATGKYAFDNVWMMTDPVAKAKYERLGRLDELEQDIRFDVLRGQTFSADDIAFAQQIDWLEQSGVIKRMASYWAVSPHPTIYRALQAGHLSLAGRNIEFRRDDQLVWLCQMGMEMFDSEVPVLIGNLRAARVSKLCGEMSSAMMDAHSKRRNT